VPVFALEYAGVDPKILGKIDVPALFAAAGGSTGGDPLALLNSFGGPPLSQVALLSSLPLLVNGIASYLLVPLSIAVGRRPVMLFAGVLAWAGGLWAGFSRSLYSHIAARCMQGLGAGAVEALIPLIVQDMMFIHQRNRAIASITASQGLIIVSLGIASPLVVTRLDWRYLYYITSGVGFLTWLLIIAFVPETRWSRSAEELGMLPSPYGPWQNVVLTSCP
jgi:MFS family permease